LALGLYTPDVGKIMIDDKQYDTDEKAIREETGVVLVEALFDTTRTLLDNGDTYGRFYKNYDRKLFKQYLERFHLQAEQRFGRLSKGEKLKFQFAFALSHDAKLLVLDEPTGNFDPEFRKELFEILKEFIADGTRSVILATHLTEDLDRIADYILYLDNGKTVFYGDIETMRARYRMVAGEAYKINLLNKNDIIYREDTSCCTRALVKYKANQRYDTELVVTDPTIEELMYFMTKGGKKV
jgi:ABC-2 type transport system ATP-binding protein